MESINKFKFKPLLVKKAHRRRGRHRDGRVVVRARHCASSNKRVNIIDWRRKLYEVKGKLVNINGLATDRTSLIGNLFVSDFMIYYNSLLAARCSIGDEVKSYKLRQPSVGEGESHVLRHVNLGIKVYNIAAIDGGRGIYSRAAGTFATIFRLLRYQAHEYMGLILPSGKKKYLSAAGMCTVGSVSNPQSAKFELGSAGANYRRGRRPKVRGVAMNPVDHPHGGGEGKTTAGRHPVSRWGKLTKGKKTVFKKTTHYDTF